MTEDQMLQILTRGLWVATLCIAPLLAIGGGVGLLVALIQAATQLNEPAISFVPKLAALGVALVFLGPWLTDIVTGFHIELYQMIAEVSATQ